MSNVFMFYFCVPAITCMWSYCNVLQCMATLPRLTCLPVVTIVYDMAITQLKVQYLYDPDAARDTILATFVECDGNMRATADDLECHYHTLLRIIKKDSKLSVAVLKARKKMHRAGIQQRGFGSYQREAIEANA